MKNPETVPDEPSEENKQISKFSKMLENLSKKMDIGLGGNWNSVSQFWDEGG